MIISAADFKTHVSRGKWHVKSKRLKKVIAQLEVYQNRVNDMNLRVLKQSVSDWARFSPKEFLAINLHSRNAVYEFFAEVNCQFYIRGLGPYQLNSQPRCLVFIPFAGQNAEEFRIKSEQWNEAEKVNLTGGINPKQYRQFQIAIWQDRTINDKVKFLETTNSEIFIRAHGSIGATHISTRNAPEEQGASITTAVSVEDVCDRLISSGLPTNYAGNIHFYSCYSGVDMVPFKMKQTHTKQAQKRANNYPIKNEHLVGPSCIARIGAKYLRSKGYVNAKYYGYLGPLMSRYSKPEYNPDNSTTPIVPGEIDEFMHRYVQICSRVYGFRFSWYLFKNGECCENLSCQSRDARILIKAFAFKVTLTPYPRSL